MISERLEAQVSLHPERIAVIYGDRRLSFGEVGRDVAALSRGLEAIGVGPGSAVALLSDNTPEFVIAYFALARRGAVAVPLNTSFKAQEIADCLAASEASCLFVSQKLAERAAAAAARAGSTAELLVISNSDDDGGPYASLLRRGAASPAAPSRRQEGPFICLFSSGSTGRPKRLLRTQANYLAEVDGYRDAIGLGPADRTLCAIPLYHSYAIGNCLLPSLLTGGTLVLPVPLEAGLAGEDLVYHRMAQLFELVEGEQITVLPNVPYVFRAMVDHPAGSAAALRSVRHCFSSGNFLPRDIFDDFSERFGKTIRSIYGCSEAGTVSVNMAEDPDFRPESVGVPLAGFEVAVLQPDGSPAGPDVVGEIAIRGPALTAGYPDLPSVSADAFRDGFFRTGDLGRLDARRSLTVTGRAKLLIDTGGRKVDPFEVEDVLRAHPGVRDAVVLGVPSAKGNEIVKAAVVLDEGVSRAAIKVFCSERLADYKVPRLIEVVEQIPKSPTGKILRKELIRAGDAVPELRELMLDIVRRGLDEMDAEPGASASFAELGIDSATIVELNLLIAEHFPGASKTLFFEHKSFRDIAAHLQRDHGEAFSALRDDLRRGAGAALAGEVRSDAAPSASAPPPAALAAPSSPSAGGAGARGEGPRNVRDEDIAIIGLAGIFPDADDVDALWANLVAGHDAIREIPAERWPIEAYFDTRRGTVGKTYGRWGGFIRDVAAFDPLFFSIAPRDAALMDPQERLFLETSYHALEDAGHTRATLARETVGVYVGVMYGEYQLWGAEDLNRSVQSSLYASIANRLSYFAGFRGPSMAIDTMCSSSLTALFMACENIARGHASMAVVGGVNLSIHPFKYVQTAQGNFLSSDGRCRSFGEGGDGYVPGEGVVAVVLKPLRRALAEGDRVRAVIAATAVNHGGHANGFTVPNPRAQAGVIAAAMQRAGVTAADIDYVEAHGTGTSLGDPIELSGLIEAMESGGGRTDRCPIGSVKSNIGHLEAAAGLAGVTKALLQFEHDTLVPSLHSGRLNPNLDFEKAPFAVQRELSRWPKKPDGAARVACVSSFGAGGSNAHVVLREAPPAAKSAGPEVPIVVISAKDEPALGALVERWLAWGAGADAPLASVAHTSQVGREALEQRLAVVCGSLRELMAALRAFREGERSSGNLFTGRAVGARAPWGGTAGRAFVEFLVAQRDYTKLAECWAQGADVPWGDLYGATPPVRVSLPRYAFSRERHWIASARRGQAAAAPAAAEESLIGIFEPRWEAASLDDAVGVESARVLCLVPSAEWGEALARAARALAGVEALRYWIPRADAPVEEWEASGGLVGATLDSWVRGASPIVVIDVIDARRADPSRLSWPIVEGHLARSALRDAGAKLSHWVVVSQDGHPASAALAGLVPAISRKLAGVPVSALRVSGEQGSRAAASILSAARSVSRARERRITSEGVESLAMRRLPSASGADWRLREGGVYLVTGGLGALGLWAGELLLAKASVRLCLLGRSAIDPRRATQIARLHGRGGEIEYHAVDVADQASLEAVLSTVRSTQGAIRGVLHCAGVPDVDPDGAPSLERGGRTLRPKVQGTLALDAATSADDLDFFTLFASTSGWLGDFGQGAYAVGNRFQIEFARARNAAVERGERRGTTCAVGWPLFRDGGMDLDAKTEELYLRSTGLRHLERAEAARCLEVAHSAKASALLVLAGGHDAVARVAESAISTPSSAASSGPAPARGAVAARPDVASSRGSDPAFGLAPRPPIGQRLRRWASEITGVELGKLELDANLGVYGFDSVTLAMFAQKISAELGVDVTATVFFACPTLGAVAKHLEALDGGRGEDASFSPPGAAEPDRPPREPLLAIDDPSALAVVGMSGRFPGAADLDELWSNLAANDVAIREIPSGRWDLRAHYGPEAPAHARTETKWGGFIEGADEFDPRFFRISPREAEEMDPQHRLFLSACWHALEDGGYDPLSLAGRRVGVFAGVQFKDYEQLMAAKSPARMTAQACTGNAHALLPNRVSYLLDLRGPSESIDTACSSSLVALHRAAVSLQRGEAEMALVGGVSLMLDPHTYLGAARLGVLSPRGRCSTFDRAADGYVRGEGVGAVLLKPLADAVRAGDPIYGVIRATAVNHGGRATSMTAPSSTAQAALLVEAYERAQFEPESIGYIEAHGTGTALGDPIEVEGIQGALSLLAERRGRALREQGFCALGSAKANIGHLEPAAGIAGFIKTMLALHHRVLPGNPALAEPNPHLRLDGGPVYLLRETIAWTPRTDTSGVPWPRRAGVSSFGYGGTNAHAALEEWVGALRTAAASARPILFVLSARDRAALMEYAARHAAWIEKHRERLESALGLHDYVFTCQVGRPALHERLAVVVSDARDLAAQLRAFSREEPSRVVRGQAPLSDAARAEETSASDLDAVAISWVGGARVRWAALWPSEPAFAPRRARAPVYPFAKTRYWFEASGPSAVAIAAPASAAPRREAPSPSGAEADASSLDRALIALASAISKIPADTISLDEDMREYGFESLTMIEFCRLASERLGIDLRPEIFFELPAPTLAVLSDRIRARFDDRVRVARGEGDAPGARPSSPVVTAPVSAPDRAGAAELEPIAIVGMAGVMPGSSDLDGFWRDLVEGKNLIAGAPADRWDHRASLAPPTNAWRGGFIDGVQEFDARFFGISPKEAELMDPQQRLFLMTVWRAVEDAGYRASDLGQRRTGLFVGVSANDYQELARDYDVPPDAYTATGIAHSVLANRVSYLLNFTGPSEPVDTACSASLIAVHRAVEQLQSGQCDVVIAGGVNLILNPRLYRAFTEAGMLSPDARCRTFDRGANGYVRGEGVGALVLKRLSDAERDGDHIRALVRGSATNHGGRANSLTAPNINAQAALLQAAYERAGVDPATVSYIEAHGTGTPLGDPVEVTALKRAFAALHERQGRAHPPVRYCGLGSVKTNIGHLETAAGVAGLFKVVLAMQNGVLPGQLHFEKLNPLIELEDSPFFIADETRPWERLTGDDGRPVPRRAGVSGFGFGGANAHVVLEEYVARRPASDPASGPQLIPLSARTEDALEAMVRSLLVWVERCRSGAARPAVADLAPWLRARAAEELGVGAAELDPAEDLRDYGMDAASLARLLGAIKERGWPSFVWSRCAGRYSVERAVAALVHDEPGEMHALGDVAATLQIGREAFEHRIALRCSSMRELEEKLRACARAMHDGAALEEDGVWRGHKDSKQSDRDADARHARAAMAAAEAGRVDELARAWVGGAQVSWEVAFGARRLSRVPLPTYPFARDRHWLRPSAAAARAEGVRASEAGALPPATAIDPDAPGDGAMQLVLAAAEWRARTEPLPAATPRAGDVVLCFALEEALDEALREHVERCGAVCFSVRARSGERFVGDAGSFVVDPFVEEQFTQLLERVAAGAGDPTHIVYGTGHAAQADPGATLRVSSFLARALLRRGKSRPVRVCHVYSSAEGGAAGSEALAGFAQALRVENPRLHMTVLDLGNGGDRVPALWAAMADAGPASQLQRIDGARWEHLALASLGDVAPFEFRRRGVYLITGGASGIGLTCARYLAREHRAKLLLLGRSELSAARRAALDELERLGAEVLYVQVDVADRGRLAEAVSAARARFGAIHGVLHGAGVTRDAFLSRKTAEQIDEVLAPKIAGTRWLDELLGDEALDFFVAFSSLTALLGNVGQTDYAYANAHLHAFAREREVRRKRGERQGRSLALAWQFWGDDGGMVTNEQARRWMWKQSGIVAVHEQVGITALRRALASDACVVATFYGDEVRIRRRLTEYAAWRAEPLHDGPRAGVVVPRRRVEAYLARLVAEESKTDLARVDPAEPLESYGLDSMMITSLNRRLEEALGALPKTLFFEFLTIADLAGYFLDAHSDRFARLLAEGAGPSDRPEREAVAGALSPSRASAAPSSGSAVSGGAREPLAIVGVAGRYPRAANVRELWENLLRGRDCVMEIPPDRWSHDDYFDPDRRAKGKTNSRWGGFIDDVDKFDARYFGIAPVEAKFMDPQERLFLEVATEALQDAGYNRASLRGRPVGVFVGVTYSHYQIYGIEETARGNPLSLGASYASIANRVSYYYDLRGPSAALDTMCSSSLTALHYACRSLWAGDCEAAVVGGTNLSVHPHKYVDLSEAHFLSSDGRCRAFGEGGDGYVPGEGIAALLIKPLRRALVAGDHVYGVVRGIAVNHGGKTNGYSVPNPRAQSEVVSSAWREAAITPQEIGYLEAHGTGTALGDPIEIAALASAFAPHAVELQSCPIGSVKANVGHLEATAGLIGITKVLLQLEHDTLVPSIHADPPNSNLELEATPFFVQRRAAPWPRTGKERVGVVSSFGAGGSNAHVVIQEVFAEAEPRPPGGPALFVCSARSPDRLRSYAGALEAALADAPHLPLGDVCFTLQVGRDELAHRLAIVARDTASLIEKLATFRAGGADADTYTGVVAKDGAKLEGDVLAADERIQAGELAEVARAWVGGARVPWRDLAPDRRPRRVSLPAYPFARERHWFSSERAPRELSPPAPPGDAPGSVSSPPPPSEGRIFDPADPIVRDHRVRGASIVPGVALLDAALLHAGVAHEVRRFAWLKPVIPVDGPVRVRIARVTADREVFHLVSGSGEGSIVHARWELGRDEPPPAPEVIDLQGLRAELARSVDPKELYARYAQRGIAYGPSFRRVAEIYADEGRVLARLEGSPERAARGLHVPTIDAALQGILLLASAAGPRDATHVPFSIGAARGAGPCAPEMWALIRRRAGDGYDVRVANASGDVCLRMDDLCTRPYRDAASRPRASGPSFERFFYRPTWL